MKSWFILTIMFLALVKLHAQNFEKEGIFHEQNLLKKSNSFFYTNPFDVIHYRLDARLAMSDSGFGGKMNIKVLILNPTDSLLFNTVGLTFASLTVNDTTAGYNLYPLTEQFAIRLPRVFFTAETVDVKIDYTRDLAFPRPIYNRQGYYWFRKDTANHIEENLGYTMSEPTDARMWMPCYDDPSDKATCEINATVPLGYQAGSNGLLVGVVNNPDTTVTFKWREDLPITTYLMVISASKYSKFSQFYHRVTNPADSIEIVNYMWQMDSAGTVWNARLALAHMPRMMEVYSTLFGEYPFAKYGHAVAYQFYYGGMEHQTLTTVHRSWLSVNSYPFYDDYFAHELSHQWWGDLVTCGTWKDIWMNEGFATYSELLWREFQYGTDSRNELLNRYSNFKDGSWRYAIYDPQGQSINLFTGNVYQKAGWVLHMLRYLVGDSTFFNILANHRDSHYYGTATTQDFINTVNAVSGQNYQWFFDEWIYGRGWVKYASQSSWDFDNKEYKVQIQQQQDVSWLTYKMPLEIKFYWPGKDSTVSVWDSLRTQDFNFILADRPDSIQLDPNNKILNQIDTVFDSVLNDAVGPTGFKLYQNYPNPFNPTTNIEYRISNVSSVSLKLYDVMGREVAVLVERQMHTPGIYVKHIDGSSLSSGIYYYRLTVTDNKMITSSETKKLVLIK
jgi:aminopeptidase N